MKRSAAGATTVSSVSTSVSSVNELRLTKPSSLPTAAPPPHKKQKTHPGKGVPLEYIARRPPPSQENDYFDGECEFTPEDKDPWIQTEYTDDSELVQFMGYPQPQHECFGCMHLNPAKGVQRTTAPIEKTRIDQLILNLHAVIGHPNINQACIDLSREYEQNIRLHANRYIKPGQEPLPHWNPATIKVHIFEHTNNPIYKRVQRIEQINDICNTAYEATCEVHPVKRKRNGKAMKRVNPVQWKIMKEAIELEHKLTFDNFEPMMSNWDSMRSYMQRNGGDFIDVSQKNVYYHILQNASTFKQNSEAPK